MQQRSRIAIVSALLGTALAGCGHGPAARVDRPENRQGAPDSLVTTTTTSVDTLPPCEGPCPLTAADVRSVYVLVDVGGVPLPDTTHYADSETPGRTCTAIVESDTLELREDGTFQQRVMGRNWCNDMPTPNRSTPDSLEGTFALHGPRGDSIAMGITALDPPVTLHGVFTGGELRLVWDADPKTPRPLHRYVHLRD